MTINYHNALANIDTNHLTDKGASQVQNYTEFIRPRYESIKSGELTKEEVARYWIENSKHYTDGAKKLLENVNDALGISKSYLSQLNTVDKFLNTKYLGKDNLGIPAYVLEHPVSVRYYLCKMQHQELWDKFLTGEHFTKREAQSKVYPGKQLPTPSSEETQTEFQKKQGKCDELIGDERYQYIRDRASAETFITATTNSSIAACMEKVSRLSVCDEKRQKQLRHLIKLCNEALEKPQYFQPYSLTGGSKPV
ncbi:hypothetical protein [Prochlorococcus marinus]|uniref:Uncharacterized protein n=1 Tax=Prochlorococcus marinus (strain MIT 9303) TaxID=59922 RepID=A2C842_PROM3|nr:hypothetical protein [Prochlorococcus marinus]ABM77652.1 Hypothetical protein P9303_09011 [Prochlorococcus marinus str. MIT 9303]